MTRVTRVRLGLGTFAVAAAMGLTLWPVDAEAGRNYVTPQAPCDKVGATAKARNGEVYECRLKPGVDCPRWSWKWHPGQPTGTWSSRPGSPCAKCTPSPSTTPSSSPAPATSSTTAAPPTTPQGTTSQPGGEDENNHPGTLPVTGASENVAALAAILGVLLILLGGTAIAVTKPWRRYDN